MAPTNQPGALARIQVYLLMDAETFVLAADVHGAAPLMRQHIEPFGVRAPIGPRKTATCLWYTSARLS